jgi:nucleotide-binding universal stress UspA family protein
LTEWSATLSVLVRRAPIVERTVMFTSLVVPVDGSELAAKAVPVAVALAGANHATVRLVGISRDDGEFASMYDHVHAAAAQAGVSPVPEADVIVDPDPTSVLLAIAAQEGNVLCFASHDRMSVAAKVMHSVGSALIVRLQHPFVVVGAHTALDSSATDVVVALDGGDDPQPLLVTAAGWARDLGAPLRLVTVYEPVLPDLRDPEHFTRHHGPPGDPDAYLDAMKREVMDVDTNSVSTTSIADPVSVAVGLREHLASRPARLFALGGRHEGAHAAPGTVRELLHSVSAPLLIVNRRATATVSD